MNISNCCIKTVINLRNCVNPILPCWRATELTKKDFSTTSQLSHVVKLTRMRVIDNSAIGKQAMLEGKPPKIIQVYNVKQIGTIGDKVLMAIKGQKIKGIVVGVKKFQKHLVPKTDTNNVVLIDETGAPLGTRIHAPIPTLLRGRKELTKLLAIATKFV
ncbi:39S ribosomal protein L14, mitochondrial [Chamberlinius hualienensis]